MLKFYYHPLSPIARRVWITLIEKEIPHEPIIVDLSAKEQFEEDFLSLNPFHHVPVLVHDDLSLIESFAIVEYLDRQFPKVPLSPSSPSEFARMRMVQMVAANELSPKLMAFIVADSPSDVSPEIAQQVGTCLHFLEKQLGDSLLEGLCQRDYFGGDSINLADITAGLTVSLFSRLGLSLNDYRVIDEWCDRLTQRPSWQTTRPSNQDFDRWRKWIRFQVKRKQRQLNSL